MSHMACVSPSFNPYTHPLSQFWYKKKCKGLPHSKVWLCFFSAALSWRSPKGCAHHLHTCPHMISIWKTRISAPPPGSLFRQWRFRTLKPNFLHEKEAFTKIPIYPSVPGCNTFPITPLPKKFPHKMYLKKRISAPPPGSSFRQWPFRTFKNDFIN